VVELDAAVHDGDEDAVAARLRPRLVGADGARIAQRPLVGEQRVRGGECRCGTRGGEGDGGGGGGDAAVESGGHALRCRAPPSTPSRGSGPRRTHGRCRCIGHMWTDGRCRRLRGAWTDGEGLRSGVDGELGAHGDGRRPRARRAVLRRHERRALIYRWAKGRSRSSTLGPRRERRRATYRPAVHYRRLIAEGVNAARITSLVGSPPTPPGAPAGETAAAMRDTRSAPAAISPAHDQPRPARARGASPPSRGARARQRG